MINQPSTSLIDPKLIERASEENTESCTQTDVRL